MTPGKTALSMKPSSGATHNMLGFRGFGFRGLRVKGFRGLGVFFSGI